MATETRLTKALNGFMESLVIPNYVIGVPHIVDLDDVPAPPPHPKFRLDKVDKGGYIVSFLDPELSLDINLFRDENIMETIFGKITAHTTPQSSTTAAPTDSPLPPSPLCQPSSQHSSSFQYILPAAQSPIKNLSQNPLPHVDKSLDAPTQDSLQQTQTSSEVSEYLLIGPNPTQEKGSSVQVNPNPQQAPFAKLPRTAVPSPDSTIAPESMSLSNPRIEAIQKELDTLELDIMSLEAMQLNTEDKDITDCKALLANFKRDFLKMSQRPSDLGITFLSNSIAFLKETIISMIEKQDVPVGNMQSLKSPVKSLKIENNALEDCLSSPPLCPPASQPSYLQEQSSQGPPNSPVLQERKRKEESHMFGPLPKIPRPHSPTLLVAKSQADNLPLYELLFQRQQSLVLNQPHLRLPGQCEDSIPLGISQQRPTTSPDIKHGMSNSILQQGQHLETSPTTSHKMQYNNPAQQQGHFGTLSSQQRPATFPTTIQRMQQQLDTWSSQQRPTTSHRMPQQLGTLSSHQRPTTNHSMPGQYKFSVIQKIPQNHQLQPPMQNPRILSLLQNKIQRNLSSPTFQQQQSFLPGSQRQSILYTSQKQPTFPTVSQQQESYQTPVSQQQASHQTPVSQQQASYLLTTSQKQASYQTPVSQQQRIIAQQICLQQEKQKALVQEQREIDQIKYFLLSDFATEPSNQAYQGTSQHTSVPTFRPPPY